VCFHNPYLKKIAFFLLIFASLSTKAEGIPMSGVLALDFSKQSVGIVAFEENNPDVKSIEKMQLHYFELNLSNWKAEPKSLKEFSNTHSETSAQVKGLISPYDWNKKWPLITSDGAHLKFKREDCKPQDEGDPICKKLFLFIGEQKIQLPIKKICPYGCGISAIEKWNNQYWIGLYTNGEIQPSGFGLHVFTAKDFKKLFSFEYEKAKEPNAFTNPEMLPTLIKRDREGKKIWVGSNIGLYAFDSNYKKLGHCSFEGTTAKKKFSIRCQASSK
jgi:hypothetical protein